MTIFQQDNFFAFRLLWSLYPVCLFMLQLARNRVGYWWLIITHTWVTTLHVLGGRSHLKVRGCYNLVPRASSSLKWGRSRWYSSSCLRGRNCTFWFPLEPVFFRCKDIPHKVVRKQIPIWREAKTFTLCWSWTRAILGAWNRRRSALQEGPVTQHP